MKLKAIRLPPQIRQVDRKFKSICCSELSASEPPERVRKLGASLEVAIFIRCDGVGGVVRCSCHALPNQVVQATAYSLVSL
jgi:hypothetical protein